MPPELSGPEKAAILMITLGEEKSAAVIEKLDDATINDLTIRIGKTQMVQAEAKLEVLRECRMLMLASEYISQGGLQYARSLLGKVLTEERVESIIEQAQRQIDGNPFDFMEKAAPPRVAEILKTEHPQTIALILANLSARQASDILALLPTEARLEVVKRIAEMEEMKPEVVDLMKKSLQEQMQGLLSSSGDSIGGVESAAEILNLLPDSDGKVIMQGLQAESPEMAEEIDSLMFTFDHLSGISQTDMEQVVRGVQTDLSLDVLAKSLKLADQAAADKFRGAMGMNVQKELDEIITTTPPMRVKDVEDEQQKIINLVKQMEAEGQITISQSGEEEELV